VAPDAVLRTSNQWLSLTDQLNLGVRALELDTHYFLGQLRVGHCGGLHVGSLDNLLKALDRVAAVLGHKVRWAPLARMVPTSPLRLQQHVQQAGRVCTQFFPVLQSCIQARRLEAPEAP
jgi:hypothetical protein